jgi:hypothetical protein
LDSTVSPSEKDAAVPALVVQRAQAVEEHHEREHQERPARRHDQGQVDAVAQPRQLLVAHARGQHVQVQAVDADGGAIVQGDLGVAAELAARGHHRQHDAHRRQHQGGRPGDQRRPEEAAAVFPELAAQQPAEAACRRDPRGRARGLGQGIDDDVHA